MQDDMPQVLPLQGSHRDQKNVVPILMTREQSPRTAGKVEASNKQSPLLENEPPDDVGMLPSYDYGPDSNCVTAHAKWLIDPVNIHSQLVPLSYLEYMKVN